MRGAADFVFVEKNLSFGGNTNYEILSKNGITAILDLRVETDDEKTEHLGMKYLKIGILDGGIPTSNQISKIIKWVNERREKKDVIFIHCNLGRGRATLVTILCLIAEGVSLEDAMIWVKKRKCILFVM